MVEDIEKYLPMWRQRLKEDADVLERRRLAARMAADRMARILITELAADRVFLVGSLLRPKDFSSHSDIDLVVVGLDPSCYFKALSRIWQELPEGMEVDLIPFEDADTYLQTFVFSEGMLLYDQSRVADTQGRT